MSTEGNGSGTAKTVKELVLENTHDIKELREEINRAKTALYVAVALGVVNVAETLISVAPTVAHAVVK